MLKRALHKAMTEKVVVSAGILREGVGVRNNRVTGCGCIGNCPKVLNKMPSSIMGLFNWKNGGNTRISSGDDQSFVDKILNNTSYSFNGHRI